MKKTINGFVKAIAENAMIKISLPATFKSPDGWDLDFGSGAVRTS